MVEFLTIPTLIVSKLKIYILYVAKIFYLLTFFLILIFPIYTYKALKSNEPVHVRLKAFEDIVKLSELFRNHLNTCAFNVTKDQEAITIEIKNLNIVIETLILSFVEKQKKYAKYCEQFKVIQDLSNSLYRCVCTKEQWQMFTPLNITLSGTNTYQIPRDEYVLRWNN